MLSFPLSRSTPRAVWLAGPPGGHPGLSHGRYLCILLSRTLTGAVAAWQERRHAQPQRRQRPRLRAVGRSACLPRGAQHAFSAGRGTCTARVELVGGAASALLPHCPGKLALAPGAHSARGAGAAAAAVPRYSARAPGARLLQQEQKAPLLFRGALTLAGGEPRPNPSPRQRRRHGTGCACQDCRVSAAAHSSRLSPFLHRSHAPSHQSVTDIPPSTLPTCTPRATRASL